MNQNCPNVARGHWRDRMTPEQYVDLMNAASMPKDRIPNRCRQEKPADLGGHEKIKWRSVYQVNWCTGLAKNADWPNVAEWVLADA